MIWNGHLDIFSEFRTDLTLPKWTILVKAKNTKSGVYENDDEESESFQMPSGGIISTGRISVVGSSISNTGTKSISSLYNDEREFYDWAAMSWMQRLWSSFKKSIFPKKKVVEIDGRPSLSTVRQTFTKIAKNADILTVIAAENEGEVDAIGAVLLEMAAYSKLIEQARNNGQTALEEKMKDGCLLFLYEAMLAGCAFNRFVSEAMLIEFLTIHRDKVATADDEEPERERYYSGFRLDWIKNFTRVLPPEVANKKALADSLMIFDNYVVFHYDPDKAASAMTRAEEEEARKDPILFGVIKGSDRLYFIADWVDEYCDLTLREVVDKLKNSGL